ncbi:MAG: hypothetical protein AB7V08_08745 [Elusimicrobiales bacterium]
MALVDLNEKLDWLAKLNKEEIEKQLSDDTLILYEELGLELLIKIWLKFGGCRFYISNSPLNELKRIYAKRFYNGTNTKRLAIELNVCEQFILNAQVDKSGSRPDDPKLFPEL